MKFHSFISSLDGGIINFVVKIRFMTLRFKVVRAGFLVAPFKNLIYHLLWLTKNIVLRWWFFLSHIYDVCFVCEVAFNWFNLVSRCIIIVDKNRLSFRFFLTASFKLFTMRYFRLSFCFYTISTVRVINFGGPLVLELPFGFAEIVRFNLLDKHLMIG